jgi:predicted dienelactone hydrolase
MLRPLIVLLLLRAGEVQADHYKVGTAERRFVPAGAYNWRGAKTHALLTQLWYPAEPAAVEKPQWIGRPDAPLFAAGKAAPDAPLAARPAKLPLVVLSHGTGGSAAMMAWLGTTLAAQGFLAVAVNHPGNNGLEDYTVQGFTLWWERAHDLTVVIDQLLADRVLGPRIDAGRIGAAGFSLGGFTMILLAGGVSDRAAYEEFCRSPRADDMCKVPPEFKDLMGKSKGLAARDREYAESLAHERQSRRDPRVRAVFAIAPALGPAFRAESLARIAVPVEIVAGAADDSVPPASSAAYFARHIPRAKLTILPGNVGHYVFLDVCTEHGRKVVQPFLCTDGAGVDRQAVHDKTAAMAARFFAAQLK